MAEVTSAEGTESTTPTETATTTAVTTVDQLPEFAQTMIKDLRTEAAKHRSTKGEAVEAAKAEVTAALQAGFDAKLAEAQAAVETEKNGAALKDLAVAKLRAFLIAADGGDAEKTDGVRAKAEKFSGLLTGTTVDEITTQADVVREFAGQSLFGVVAATDPSPEGKPLALNDDDGLLAALKSAVGAR